MSLIITFILLLILNAFFDAYLISELKEINHAKSTFLWTIVYIVTGGIMYTSPCVTKHLFVRVVVLLPFARWIVHDLLLNALRGKVLNYLGSGKNASVLDKFLARLPFPFIFLKLGLFGGVLVWALM